MPQLLDLILLVDDDETTNHVNKRLLSRLNIAHEIKVLENGQQALDYLKIACGPDKVRGTICPDLIFLDIKMPVMDGFTFLEAYEQTQLDQQNPIIIMMLTSSASFYDLERLKQFEKVKRHLSKALTESDVKEIIKEHFNRSSQN